MDTQQISMSEQIKKFHKITKHDPTCHSSPTSAFTFQRDEHLTSLFGENKAVYIKSHMDPRIFTSDQVSLNIYNEMISDIATFGETCSDVNVQKHIN